MTTQLYRQYGKDGALLYVGISLIALRRLREHKASSRWFEDVARIEIENFATREDAVAAELTAIRNEQPVFNVVGRDYQLARVQRIALGLLDESDCSPNVRELCIAFLEIAAEPVAQKPRPEKIGECRSCAARREAKRVAQAKWRRRKTTK